MKKIYLVRHGQSTANAGGEAQPNAEIELTALGHQQAYEAAQWLEQTLGQDIKSVNVSSYIRTQQTAQPLVDRLNSKHKLNIKPQLIEGLQEFDLLGFKRLKGASFEQRMALTDAYWQSSDPAVPYAEDAESFRDFYQRIPKVLRQFEQFEPGNHVVYTHGYWISMLIWYLLGLPADDSQQVVKFRQFELSIRAKNGEVFCLTLPEQSLLADYAPSITKVRTCSDQNSDLSANRSRSR